MSRGHGRLERGILARVEASAAYGCTLYDLVWHFYPDREVTEARIVAVGRAVSGLVAQGRLLDQNGFYGRRIKPAPDARPPRTRRTAEATPATDRSQAPVARTLASSRELTPATDRSQAPVARTLASSRELTPATDRSQAPVARTLASSRELTPATDRSQAPVARTLASSRELTPATHRSQAPVARTLASSRELTPATHRSQAPVARTLASSRELTPATLRCLACDVQWTDGGSNPQCWSCGEPGAPTPWQ